MTPRRRRRLAYTSIAVVTVACLVGVSVLAVAAGGSALAYKVNDTRVSQHDFDQQLDDLANTDALASQVSHTEGSVDSKVTAQVLTNNIVLHILRDEAARKGVHVTDADRDQARQSIGNQLDDYPESYRNLQVDLQAHFHALGLDSDDAMNAFVSRAVRHADIEVDPRYGFWNPRRGVCPPTGCAATG